MKKTLKIACVAIIFIIVAVMVFANISSAEGINLGSTTETVNVGEETTVGVTIDLSDTNSSWMNWCFAISFDNTHVNYNGDNNSSIASYITTETDGETTTLSFEENGVNIQHNNVTIYFVVSSDVETTITFVVKNLLAQQAEQEKRSDLLETYGYNDENTFSTAIEVVASTPTTNIDITDESMEITVGDPTTIGYTATDGVTIVWSSDDESVATVDGGVVTGQSPGTATITAMNADDSNVYDTIIVHVTETTPSSGDITISGTNTVIVGGTTTLTVTGADGDVTWSSSDTSVATVDGGEVTGQSAGNATISATDGSGNTASFDITVTSSSGGETQSEKLTLDRTSVTLEVGGTVQINKAEGPEISSWKSDTESVAVVSDGLILGVSAGSAVITATATASDGTILTASVTVIVNNTSNGETSNSESSPKLSESEITLAVGATKTITSDKTVTWESSNESIAVVNTDGTITGISVGVAVITARSTEDSTFSTVTVTVTNASTSSTETTTGTNSSTGTGTSTSTATGSTTSTSSSSGTRTSSGNSTSTANQTISQTGESEVQTLAVLIIATLIVSAIIFRKKSKIK